MLITKLCHIAPVPWLEWAFANENACKWLRFTFSECEWTKMPSLEYAQEQIQIHGFHLKNKETNAEAFYLV